MVLERQDHRIFRRNEGAVVDGVNRFLTNANSLVSDSAWFRIVSSTKFI